MPISYSVDGKQYITLTAGPLTGVAGGFGSVSAQWGTNARIHPRRLMTFALDAKTPLPATPLTARIKPLAAPQIKVDAKLAEAGGAAYIRCVTCHGPGAVAGGAAPDLRASALLLSHESFAGLLRSNALVSKGMPQFDDLSDQQIEQLRHYVRQKANETLAAKR